MRRDCPSVGDDLSGKDLVAEQLRDGVGNLGRARIVAVDHERPERDGVREGLPRCRLVECGLGTEGVPIELAHGVLPLRVYALH